MEEKVIDIHSIVNDVLKNLLVLILTALTIMLLGHIVIKTVHKPVYKTTLSYVVTLTDSSGTTNYTVQSKLVNVFQEVLESNILKKAIIASNGYDKTIPAEITTEIVQDTSGDVAVNSNIIIVTVTANNPKDAFEVACALRDDCQSVSDYINDNAILTLLEVPRLAGTDSEAVSFVKMDAAVFSVSFILLICLVAFVSVNRNTIKTSEEIRDKLNANLLSSVPDVSLKGKKNSRRRNLLINDVNAGFYYVENIKKIRSKIERAKKCEDGMTIAVSSIMAGEGKSTLAANIALSLAMQNNKVLLVDMDFKKPALYEIMHSVKNSHENEGKFEFTDFLSGKSSMVETLVRRDDMLLWAMYQRNRKANSSEIISSDNMKTFISYARQQFDYVIIDTSPVSLSADMEVLAEIIDNALIVIKQDTAKADDINNAIDMLSRNKCEFLGCVYNFDSRNTREDAYGYGYGRGKAKYSDNYGYGNYGRRKTDTKANSAE